MNGAAQDDPVDVARTYYDSEDADNFYAAIWGGEDIHVGIYRRYDEDIRTASRRTVQEMASRLEELGPEARVLDLGAGYGGAARYLAGTYGCRVTCLNLSTVENERNRALTESAGLSDRVDVVEGSFESIPEPARSFDYVWSQDAILHSGDREQVMAEAVRVLEPGGEIIFTDPMMADGLEDQSVLAPIYDRLHLDSLGSVEFYRDALTGLECRELGVDPRLDDLRTHYSRVGEELERRRDELTGRVSPEYIDRMLVGLGNWVGGAQAGHLAWGILHFRKL
jgi:sarcosine/dimethylglycine N-methyltransferase